MTSLRLYRHPLSGHCHRVELLLSLLGLPCELQDVDLIRGEHRAQPFLALNPFGQVPVLRDGALALADSNAILVYLASRYDPARRWLPEEPVAAASVQRWLSVAAGQLAAGPAALRRAAIFRAKVDEAAATATAQELFRVMEHFLARAPFLTGEAPTLADVALYAYTAHAPEGGFSLAPYPAVSAWLARVEALPRFVPMRRWERR